MESKNPKISLQIPKEMLEEIRREAKKDMTSVSTIVRQALHWYLQVDPVQRRGIVEQLRSGVQRGATEVKP